MNFNLNSGFKFEWCGVFSSPDEDWVHMTRRCDSYEIFCVTDGTLYIADDSREYTVHSGEYLITPPCANQRGWRPSKCSFYWFHFYAEDGGAEFHSQGRCPRVEILERYMSLFLLSHPSGNLVAALLHELLFGESAEKASGREALLRQIRQYVKFSAADALSVAQLAAHMGYNEKYLSQIFSRETGETLQKYILCEIIGRAKYLLSSTQMTVNRIGLLLGYSDSHNFSHMFKKNVGVSPREYRRDFING